MAAGVAAGPARGVVGSATIARAFRCSGEPTPRKLTSQASLTRCACSGGFAVRAAGRISAGMARFRRAGQAPCGLCANAVGASFFEVLSPPTVVTRPGLARFRSLSRSPAGAGRRTQREAPRGAICLSPVARFPRFSQGGIRRRSRLSFPPATLLPPRVVDTSATHAPGDHAGRAADTRFAGAIGELRYRTTDFGGAALALALATSCRRSRPSASACR
jgi:hypothetical protein